MNSRRQTSDGGEGRESRAGVRADVLSPSPLFFLCLLLFFSLEDSKNMPQEELLFVLWGSIEFHELKHGPNGKMYEPEH